MNFIRQSASEAGWADSNVHFEAFEPLLPTGDEKEFELRAARSGLDLVVRPNQTAAQALEEAGISVAVSCEQGICGTCLVSILEGTAEHRDSYQTDEEKKLNRQFALCCSRSKSEKLVLEI